MATGTPVVVTNPKAVGGSVVVVDARMVVGANVRTVVVTGSFLVVASEPVVSDMDTEPAQETTVARSNAVDTRTVARY
jgi:hypothetical protein